MIFPDMPKKRYFWTQEQIDKMYQDAEMLQSKMQPGRLADDEIRDTGDRAEEWLSRHFPEQPNVHLHASPTPTFREDPWGYIQFFAIIVGMVVWALYWHQFQ
jgi:hypothetical protein